LNPIALTGFLLMLGAATAAAADPVDATSDARAARFYAEGLEKPLLELRNGALLGRACTERLKRACTKEQRELAAGDTSLTLLDALTLFPQRPATDPAADLKKPAELRAKMAATSAALLRAAGEYDRLLLARFGATLTACPDEENATLRGSLDELVRLDLAGFQSLAGDELARAQQAIAAEESAATARLQRTPVDCAATRLLGIYLMQLMHAKLLPWSGEDERAADAPPSFDFRKPPPKQPAPEPPKTDLAHAVAGNFVTVVATELQLTVFPESEAAIKSIADEVGKAAPAD